MDFFKFVLSVIFIANILPVESYNYSNISEYVGDGAWIRLCSAPKGADNNNLGAAKAEKCTSGFWFKDPVNIGCACGHGVWIFAKSWCDPNVKIVIAYNGSCFSVDKEVRFVRNIGYSQQAFVPYHFQTTSGFEYVQELPAGFDYTYSNPNYDQHLGSIFAANEIESVNAKRCLEVDDFNKKPLALKYFVDRLPFRQVDECFGVAGQPNLFKYDEEFDLNRWLVARGKSNDPLKPLAPPVAWNGNGTDKCYAQCIGDGVARTTPNPVKQSTLPPDYVDPMIDDYYPFEHNHSNVTNKTKKCDYSMKTYSLTNKTVKEITEQTKRMIMANLGNALKGIVTPVVEVNDYVYFQMARKVLLNVCPNEEVPHSLVTGLLRMFRVAVKESLRFYPYTESGDGNQSTRITQNLKNCLSQARPFMFEYKNTTEDFTNSTDSNSTNSSSECPTEFDKITYTYVSFTNRTLQTGIPCELETDLKQLDLPVETAWKTVMFTHYYCARHFAANLTDYAAFYAKMEQFFNRWIQHRWYYPGPSLKAYEYIFQSYDLKKFAENLDRCIGASRSFSSFRKWIKRPIYVKHCGGTLFQEMDDPTNNPKPKLDAIAPKLTEFDNKAYCLPYWHSPASTPGINYDPSKDVKEGCVTYKKGEWEDDMTPASPWTNEM